MKVDNDLVDLEISEKERATLALNHRVTYTKKIPSTKAYSKAKIINNKYKFQLNLAPSSPKPISKMGVPRDECS